MKLLIRQKVFSLKDRFNVYDEAENVRYTVEGEWLSLGKKLHIYNAQGMEVGMIRQKLFTLLPKFEIIINGEVCGTIEKKFTLFKPRYDIDFNGWRAEGDFIGWNYEVWQACSVAMRIYKKLFTWGDTYVIDYAEPVDELAGLMLVLTIDAVNSAAQAAANGANAASVNV